MKNFSKVISCFLTAAILCSIAVTAPVSAATLKKPSGFKAVNTQKGVKLSWKSVSGAKKYIVSRRLSSAKKFKALKSVKLHTFIDTSAKAGKKYVYNVAAVSGNTKAVTKGKTIIRLKTPGSFTVKLISDIEDEDDLQFGAFYSAKLTWKKVKGAKRYEIRRSTITGSSISTYKTIGYSKSTSFVDYSTRSGSYYKYKIRALNGKKFKSAFTKATAKKGYLEAPYAYAEVTSSYKGVRVSWEGCTGAKGYKLYKSTDKGKTYKLLKDSKSFKKADGDYYYDDNDVTVGNVYYYYVQSYNAKMTSKLSDSNKVFIQYKDYDLIVEEGEAKSSQELSHMYTYIQAAAKAYEIDMDMKLSSEDESIVTVDAKQAGDGSYNVSVTGVRAGYANIILTVSSNGVTETQKIRVKVSAEPVYDVVLKKGETDRIYDFGDNASGNATIYSEEGLKISVTSGNTDVVRVNNPNSMNFTLTGVSAGEAMINIKITAEMENTEQTLVNQSYSVLVKE